MMKLVDSLLYAACFALIVEPAHASSWIFGALLGVLLPPALPRSLRLKGLARYLAGAARLGADGTMTTLRALVGAAPTTRSGYFDLDLGNEHALSTAALGFAATAGPGTALVDDDAAPRLLFNTIDASDPDAERARLRRFLADHQRGLFGRDR